MYKMAGVSRLCTSPKYGAEELTLRRYNNSFAGGIAIVDGLRSRGTQAYREFAIMAAVQPVSGDDLLQVPDGDRFNEQLYIWVWHTFEQPQPNDYVLREGQQYLAMSASLWGSFTQSRIQRIDVGPDRALDL